MKNNKIIKLSLISLSVMSVLPINAYALTKEETVYSKLNNNGEIINTSVYEHLINTDKLDTITDLSDLENITNINNNNKFEYANNTLTWDAKAKDIFYKGTTNKSLPISEDVTYKLDGNDISLSDMLGKSGHVEITIKYTNNDLHYNNKYGNMYTPFMVATVTSIEGKNNSNVEVTNGKVINNGNNYMVVAISLPGLSESLGIEEKIDSVTISYDTTKVELSTIYSVMSPKIIEETDMDIFNKLNNIYSKGYDLKTYMDEIESGSKDILEGLEKVSSGNTALKENLTSIIDNISLMEEGSKNLSNGINEIITNLEGALEELNSNDNLEKINSAKLLMENNTKTINNLKEVNSKLKEYYDNYNLSSIKYEEILNSELENKMDLYNIKYSYENTYESNQNLMQLLTLNNQAISDSLNTLNASSTKINGMITMLKGYLLETEKGANDLNGGLTELKQGMIFYDTKMSEVNTGLTELNNGMSTLNDGIIEFNKEGISTIANYMNKLSNLTDKIEVLTDYSNSYKTISITNNEIKGTTKFVNVIEGVKVQETKTDTTTNSIKLSFIDRVKNLFK